MLRSSPSPPILVTGAHRSGTTWVGSMLALARNTVYIHEPFNADLNPAWVLPPFEHWYQHLLDGADSPWPSALDRAVALHYPVRANLRRTSTVKQKLILARNVAWSVRQRVVHPRVIVKDPLALFSAEWFALRYSAPVVITVRHPAAFVSSIVRLDWRFRFENWSLQPVLMNGLLAPWEAEIRRAAADRPTTLEGAILMWKVLYGVVDGYRQRHPDWTFVRHEDLAASPVQGFRDVYSRLGLQFNDTVCRGLERHTRSGNTKEVAVKSFREIRRDSVAASRSWTSRMSADDIEHVRRSLGGSVDAWYDAGSWELNGQH